MYDNAFNSIEQNLRAEEGISNELRLCRTNLMANVS